MKNLVRFVGILVILVVAILSATQARATVLAQDTFTYADGVLPSPWALFSGSGGVAVIGNQASVSGASSGGGDMGLPFSGTHTSDQIFAGFDATVTSWTATEGVGYFAMFKDASTFNFFSRTFVTNVAGQVEFGISAGAIGTGIMTQIWSSAVALGSVNRVVMGLDQTGATMVSSLYLNGSLVGSVATTNATGYSISQFALRQSNTATEGSLLVDNLSIADTFGEANVIPEPSTIMLLGVGLISLLAIRRRS